MFGEEDVDDEVGFRGEWFGCDAGCTAVRFRAAGACVGPVFGGVAVGTEGFHGHEVQPR